MHHRIHASIVSLLACAALVPPVVSDAASSESAAPVLGITLSTHTDGRDWASDSIVPSMREMREVGANWVTIHPYAGVRSDGSLRFRTHDPANPPEHIVRPIREAHALGLKILIKPHLAYWGSPFRWRGDIAFDDERSWARFWRDYERWIVGIAAVSRDADALAVGTELDGTIGREAAWRRIIERVRAVSEVPLTYGANWDAYERVPFWDALDAIGIQAYFPLTEREGADERAIREGWSRWMTRLAEFSNREDRYIVFTELGYNRSTAAPVRPWEGGARKDASGPEVQETCMRAALQAIADEPRVLGAFLWKWFPEPHPVGRDFQLATPRMKRLLRSTWAR